MTTPNPFLFWTSFAIMMVIVVGGGAAIGIATQQYAVAFALQLIAAGAWVATFFRYRPRRAADQNRMPTTDAEA
ncbi:hypothetical protein DEU37_0186 [Microbacterium sp. AG790]|uniref:hypothetical protein n=1 Tax=Microbacterium sp. AG790 TaxID=2183995 RepID=UPI000EB599DE|nr:hypothetical protein [Microbacterium sp. AG790]RKS92796.1 hypothetical protein DEU37_0186 [Microbacterium sp. AG790]